LWAARPRSCPCGPFPHPSPPTHLAQRARAPSLPPPTPNPLPGFALVGGPARQDAPKAIEALKELNVPYLVSLPLVFQTTEEWLGSELGVHPVQVALQVALPELDGALEPIVFAGRDSNTGKSHSLPDRVASLAMRAVNWARLRKKPNAQKKLAITVFSFPPDKGNVGTAAYLNVFGSIVRVLRELKKEGYDVGQLPSNEGELIQSVLQAKEARFNSSDLNVAYRRGARGAGVLGCGLGCGLERRGSFGGRRDPAAAGGTCVWLLHAIISNPFHPSPIPPHPSPTP
jgi:hypothetical protein